MTISLTSVFTRARASLKHRTVRSVAALVAVLLVSVACSAGDQTESVETSTGEKPEITVGLTAGPVTLDPAKDSTGGFLIVRALTHEPLIHQEPDGSFSPGLATKWGYVGTGNKEFELTLRERVQFSDGEPLTAEAVKGWIEYFANGNGSGLVFLGPVESIEAVDELTVRIKLEIPNPVIPWALSDQNNWGAISSPAAVKDPKSLGTQTFGAGPYVLDAAQTVTEDHYTFVPNDLYYDQSAIRFSKVTAKIISTPSSMLQAVNAGQVDVAQGDPATAQAVSPEVDVLQAAGSVALLTLDRGGEVSEPLADVRVRQALNYAVNRDEIAKAIFGEYAKPATQMGSSDGANPEGEGIYTYDIEKAKKLLADAGYPDGFTAEALAAGQPELSQAIAQDFQKVGVTLKLKSAKSSAEWVQEIQGNKTIPILQAGTQTSRSMWLQYGAFLKEKGFYNILGNWSDPELDQLYLDGAAAEDPTPYWTAITKRVTEEAYFIPVVSVNSVYYASKDLDGVTLSDKRMLPIATEWSPRNP